MRKIEKKNVIKKSDEREYYPLTAQQERVLYISLLAKNYAIWNRISCKELIGNLNPKAMKEAVLELVEKHNILRVLICSKDGIYYQKKRNVYVNDVYEYSDISKSRKDEADAKAMEIVNDAAKTPINVLYDSLFSVRLIKVEDNRYYIYIRIHHILSDETTINILWRDLRALYKEKVKGNVVEKSTELDYFDYALWHAKEVLNAEMEKEEQYWMKEFSGLNIPNKLLNKLYLRKETRYEGESVNTEIRNELVNVLERKSLINRTTLFTTLYAAFYVLLSCNEESADVTIGTFFSGRQYDSALRNMVGFFVNTVAVRAKIDYTSTFKDFSNYLQTKVREAYENQNYPVEKIVSNINSKGVATIRLYNALFNYVTEYVTKEFFEGASSESNINTKKYYAQIDLYLDIRKSNNGMNIQLEFNKGIYNKDKVKSMARQYVSILNYIADEAEVTLEELIRRINDESCGGRYLDRTSNEDLEETIIEENLDKFDNKVNLKKDSRSSKRNKKEENPGINEQLLEIAKDIIGVRDISINDNIFVQGIDSLVIILFSASIEDKFGVSISNMDFIELPTIDEIGNKIRKKMNENERYIEQ